MSFRPPFLASNASFPPLRNNSDNNPSPTNSFTCKLSNSDHRNAQNNFPSYNTNPSSFHANHSLNSNVFIPTPYDANNLNQELQPPNQIYNNAVGFQQSINNVASPYLNSMDAYSINTQHSGPQQPNFNNAPLSNQYNLNQHVRQNFNREAVNNFYINSGNVYFNNDQRNVTTQRFLYTGHNLANCNSSAHVSFQGYQNSDHHRMLGNNVPSTFDSLPPNFSVANENSSNFMSPSINNTVHVSGIRSNQASVPVHNSNSLLIQSTAPNVSPVLPHQWQNNSFLNRLPPTTENNASQIVYSNNAQNSLSEKELKLTDFLVKFTGTDKKNENKILIPDYRSALKDTFSLLKMLIEKKSKLKNLLESDESEWRSEMQSTKCFQKQLSEMCSLISSPDYLNIIMNKLKHIKRKRGQKKKTKLNKLSEKIKAEQNKKELHQKIDKWLDDIKEKNLKLKREVEMKKEADFILLEVRKKIQEANRTIEKIKMLEKLRNARQSTAVQKGLHILPEHNDKFEKKMFVLKETMLKQLADYEAEEKALKVMLETEQEGQLEEKAQWELKRVKTLQEKKQNHIAECLFGISEDPVHTDPMYLFHKYHTSADSNVENLVQIRHQWDLHIAEDGEPIPQHWVVPVAPSDNLWEKCLITSKN